MKVISLLCLILSMVYASTAFTSDTTTTVTSTGTTTVTSTGTTTLTEEDDTTITVPRIIGIVIIVIVVGFLVYRFNTPNGKGYSACYACYNNLRANCRKVFSPTPFPPTNCENDLESTLSPNEIAAIEYEKTYDKYHPDPTVQLLAICFYLSKNNLNDIPTDISELPVPDLKLTLNESEL